MNGKFKVSIHQPAYIPWLGYFDRIAKSDLFIFLDTVQFEKNSFINRNKVKGPNGPHWLTVPVKQKGHLQKKLSSIEIDNTVDWRKKHLKSIYNNYLSCPGFNDKYEKLEILYSSYKEKYLTELCFTQLQFWLTELNITTKVIRSSSLQTNEVKSNLILELCQLCNANEYISGPMGKNYLNEDEFTKSGIDIYYHIYEHITYPQRFGSFIPCMGIIDFWFNRFTY
ncbi:hypothetical protein CF115_06115 [Aeromonas veronii]|uniref:WbqC family protein n=1 Tax=Aeromonas veronii TaxID=654 RepID=UPI00111741E4|nr:WbqC family protein [Aeromonas veronii]TNJ09472.1 hypothetical protein CF115_06115 [Aeromonas veronii]